jgi:hypothetical protein
MRFKVWHISIAVIAFTAWSMLGCSQAGKLAPTAPAISESGGGGGFASESLIRTLANSTWTGTSTTNYPATGHSGTASVTFTAPGGPNNGNVAATISWTLAGTSTVFNGTASGTLDNILLDAPESQTHGCSTYQAHGTVQGNVFSGSYSGSCHNSATAILGDAGTFTLTRQVGPDEPPVDPPTVFCHVPPGNPAQAQTLTLPLSAVQAGHIPQHPLDYYGACK